MGRERQAVKISLFFHLSVGKHVEPCPSVGSTVYSLSLRNSQNPAAAEVWDQADISEAKGRKITRACLALEHKEKYK